MTARKRKTGLKGHKMRDIFNIYQLIVLANLKNLNYAFFKTGKTHKKVRFDTLKIEAITQLTLLSIGLYEKNTLIDSYIKYEQIYALFGKDL